MRERERESDDLGFDVEEGFDVQQEGPFWEFQVGVGGVERAGDAGKEAGGVKDHGAAATAARGEE